MQRIHRFVHIRSDNESHIQANTLLNHVMSCLFLFYVPVKVYSSEHLLHGNDVLQNEKPLYYQKNIWMNISQKRPWHRTQFENTHTHTKTADAECKIGKCVYMHYYWQPFE